SQGAGQLEGRKGIHPCQPQARQYDHQCSAKDPCSSHESSSTTRNEKPPPLVPSLPYRMANAGSIAAASFSPSAIQRRMFSSFQKMASRKLPNGSDGRISMTSIRLGAGRAAATKRNARTSVLSVRD